MQFIVLNNDVKMINLVLPFLGQDMMKGTFGRDNQKQTNVTSAKYYMFRAFPEI